MNDLKHISRIDNHPNHGWYVRVSFYGKEYTKLFSDVKWNGKEGALEAAKRHRRRVLKVRSNLEDYKKGTRFRKKKFYYPDPLKYKNSTDQIKTGMVGIYRQEKVTKTNVYLYYNARATVHKGKPRSKLFNIEKLGELKAFNMAANWRKEMMSRGYPHRFDEETFERRRQAYITKLKQLEGEEL